MFNHVECYQTSPRGQQSRASGNDKKKSVSRRIDTAKQHLARASGDQICKKTSTFHNKPSALSKLFTSKNFSHVSLPIEKKIIQIGQKIHKLWIKISLPLSINEEKKTCWWRWWWLWSKPAIESPIFRVNPISWTTINSYNTNISCNKTSVIFKLQPVQTVKRAKKRQWNTSSLITIILNKEKA